MNIKTQRKLKHIKFVAALVGGLISLVFFGNYLSTFTIHPLLGYVGRIISALTLVGLSWVLVSALYGYVKRTTLIVLSFLALFIYGMTVYHNMNKTIVGHENPSQTTTLLAPINNTLSLFFPSRGAYSEEDHSEMETSYQVLQLLSYFFFALLAFSLFGKKILNRSGSLLMLYHNKNIFWEYSDNGLALAQDITQTSTNDQILFVLSNMGEYNDDQNSCVFDKIDSMGAVALYTDHDKADLSKRCFSGYRHFFMTEDQNINVRMALAVLDKLIANPQQKKTHLYIRTEIEYIDQFFEVKLSDKAIREQIEIHIYNHSALTARLFVSDSPALERNNMKIDTERCSVEGELNVLLLGFGWTGFELLKKIVCDTQFKKLKLSIQVIDSDYTDKHGRYKYILEDTFNEYNISINPLFGGEELSLVNSKQFYDWLNDEGRIRSFNRIIVAMGDDELNVNTALQLHRFRINYQYVESEFEPIFAHVRNVEQYKYYQNSTSPIRLFGEQTRINTQRVLINQEMDRVAKMVHYVYSRNDVPLFSESEFESIITRWSPIEEQWAKASIFNQESCRAVAMNIDNMARLCGGEQLLSERLREPHTLELFAELEHLRWNSFHFVNGVKKWDMSQVTTENGKLRFGTILSKHICLIPYDQLEQAADKVNSLRKPTDPKENYTESDKRIVRHFNLFLKFKNEIH